MKKMAVALVSCTLLLGACAKQGAHYTGVNLQKVSSYETYEYDQSAAEIVAYDKENKRMFIVNGATDGIDVVDITNVKNPIMINSIDLSAYGKAANSVAFKNGMLAVAVEDFDKQANGRIVVFGSEPNFEFPLLEIFMAGALPDMVTFSEDGDYIVAANEGEPNKDYSVDPEGSITVIDISDGLENAKTMQATFNKFDAQKAALQKKGVRISHPKASVSQDLEPEYVTISPDSETAYVSLQENNAMAVVDLEKGEVVDILPLGLKDWKGEKLTFDASDKDGMINMKSWPVYGAYMPDSVASYEFDGETYIVTANEGDGREYGDYTDEGRVGKAKLDKKAFPNAKELQEKKNLGRLKYIKDLSDTDGDGDLDRIVAFGARSFSIFDSKGTRVFDSGSDFEEINAGFNPKYFNTTNDKHKFDNRSDDKGPEPEALCVGEIDGRTYAFIGLERAGGIMVYDVTDPKDVTFVQYVVTTDFTGDPKKSEAGDLGPEGFKFVPAKDSPNGKNLLLVGNEVSGSTSIFEVTPM